MEETRLANLEDETKPKKYGWGGARPGGGRPLGSKNKATLERKVIEEEFRNRILSNIHELLTAQINVARGASFLYRIDQSEDGKRREHVLVTDPNEIKEFLDELEGGAGVVNEHYYYISTKEPDNRALDSLFDRVFGRAHQSSELSVKGNVAVQFAGAFDNPPIPPDAGPTPETGSDNQ